MSIKSTNRLLHAVLVTLVLIVVFLVQFTPAHADGLLPGEISTCGELSISGTYTLIATITAPANTTCFTVSSDNVIIDGQGIYSIQGSSASLPAIDARKYSNGSLVEGANGYTLIITGLTISGYTTLVDASGNSDTTGSGQNSGYGGNAGSVAISYSTTTASNIIANGGDASTKTNGGDGGNIVFTDFNLDVSNKNISLLGGMGTAARGASGGLTLTYSGTINKSQLTASDLSYLNVNSATTTDLYGWTVSTSSPTANWNSITSSADGMKLAAVASSSQIYTSSDAGVTWNVSALSTSTAWRSVASSADGTKLFAVASSSSIYVSTTSGTTWVARDSSRKWYSITTSADGTKVAAVANGGQIYTSTNSGVNWVARDSNRAWTSVTSSADGVKLAATVSIGQIYTSTDSGITWTARDSARAWSAVTSSADGVNLAATVNSGQIYTSTDSGLTWTARDSSRSWTSISSSFDGNKLVAVAGNVQIYTSTDAGVTWTARESSRTWVSVTTSADGINSFAAMSGGKLYTSQNYIKTFSGSSPVVPILPFSGTNSVWAPYISWGTATSSCSYSMDGGPTHTLSCANNGTDIPSPVFGSHTLVLRGTDAGGVTATKTISFTYSHNLSINTVSPINNGLYYPTTWSPVIDWDINRVGNLTLCQYSYDNWVSSTTVGCSNNGSDILASSSEGTSTLYFRSTDSSGSVANASTSYSYLMWVPRAAVRNWKALALSSDGLKLVAVVYQGQIYTSVDAGTTWTPRDSVRDWVGVTSSADGAKLAATVNNSHYIYTSSDSGVTWTPNYIGWTSQSCYSIVSSADGRKLSAICWSIFTSTDFGLTWTTHNEGSLFEDLTSSADGTRLAVADYFGYIYISSDSGLTWNARDTTRSWSTVSSSADGTILAAAIDGDQIYTSTDSGLTWNVSTTSPSKSWNKVAVSADGMNMVAVGGNSQVYTSVDSGVTWSPRDLSRSWRSVTSSADGNRLAGYVSSGQIYTYQNPSPQLKVDYILPQAGIISSWTPYISWGTAVHCEYSLDGGSTTTLACANHGSDIPRPSYGSHLMAISGTDAASTTVSKSQSFTLSFDIRLNRPVNNSVLGPSTWTPSIVWDVNNLGNLTLCRYSYDNWVSSSTVNCANNGSDILASSSEGTSTLYVKATDSQGNSAIASSTYGFSFWTLHATSQSFSGVSSSADGTKLAGFVQNGQVYTSADSGVTWTARETNRFWSSIASSADGTKLVAVVYGGQVYTSVDSGVTWTPRDSNRSWQSVASSADGSKLVAAEFPGQVYTSTDYGVTWVAHDSSRRWRSVTSSADGTRLAATVDGGQIYTSNNGGQTWTAHYSSLSWGVIASSADGSRLVTSIAYLYAGQVYISNDYGQNWTFSTTSPTAYWRSITASADGMRLVAIAPMEKIYISSDFGLTWSQSETARNWISVSSSADGMKISAVGNSQVYTYSNPNPTLSVDFLTPQTGTTTSWSPYVSWGTATSCYYSIDGGATSTKVCANHGSDISRPAYGTHTLSIAGTDSLGHISAKSVTVTLSFGIGLARPATGSLVTMQTWSPLINWDQNGAGNLLTCKYSYNNWVSSTTVNCANNGSDIIASTSEGTSTVYLRATDSLSNTANASTTFFLSAWTPRATSQSWRAVTSSADGVKLAAVASSSGQIYTSTDSGLTWTARESARNWFAITSSADGTKLAAAVSGGQIYTSTDSGVTWNISTTSSSLAWVSIASSFDGNRLVAAASGSNYIYISANAGLTWTAVSSYANWLSVASSVDGSKLVAVVYGGQIYTSSNYGITWTPRDSNRNWYSVTSSADGTKLAAVVGGNTATGQIYTSTDSGATWTARDSARNWMSISSSVDGTRLQAAVYNGKIYLSNNSGVTWAAATNSPSVLFTSVAASADGSKSISAINSGQIYTYQNPAQTLYVNIAFPSATTTKSWLPYISWGNSTLCQYSMDGGSTSTIPCANLGSDIPKPTFGAHVLAVAGTNAASTTVATSTSFTRSVGVVYPANNSSVYTNTWTPSVPWDVYNVGNTAMCQYSYNNWVSSTTVNCANNGSDIMASTSEGTSTLYIRATDSTGVVSNASSTFAYSVAFIPRGAVRSWIAIASSADGNKLAAAVNNGQIYTSTDSGISWAVSSSSPVLSWRSVASSADGTKLAAVGYGLIYTSQDSGLTWSTHGIVTNWYSITSSADGSKLAALIQSDNGKIYTSNDFGMTWISGTVQLYGSTIVSSADGVRLAAVGTYSQIYTSSDSGVSWNVSTSSPTASWRGLTSSADGMKLAAVASSNIYTSTDAGLNWTTHAISGSSGNWYSMSSSADGTKLVAGDMNARTFTSTDSGFTWTYRSSASAAGIASIADGSKFAIAGVGNYIYTFQYPSRPLSVDVLLPQTGTTTLWSPYISWGTATLCQYSIDGGSTTTVTCANNGSDISRPSYGAHSLVVSGTDSGSTTVTKTVTFSLLFGMNLSRPVSGTSYTPLTWSPYVIWDINNTGNISSCQYSYNNWVSSTTVNCANNGSDISAPNIEGNSTLYIRGADNMNNVIYASSTFSYFGYWTARATSQYWISITSSADGKKLAAVIGYDGVGYIYTSTDSGVTWVARATSQYYWNSITSSADGTRLVAIAGDDFSSGQIFTSSDSGLTWVGRDNSLIWSKVASSADGSKLVASLSSARSLKLYTSSDYGVTWTARGANAKWTSVTSSADGTKLAATVSSGQIYTSTDSGVTWNISNLSPSAGWASITSSSDGTKLAAVGYAIPVYTSSDSGATWNAQNSGSRYWMSITSSADGTKLAAAVYDGQIYISTDSGVTWIARDSSRSWYSITSSADGNKLAAAVYDGQIYTYSNLTSSLSVDILLPQATTTSRWTPIISWGTAVLCQYSLNSGSTTTVSCANNGIDIAHPSPGSNTLNVIGTDSVGSTSLKSVTFTYTANTWCGTVDSNWMNANNWFTNTTCTTPAAIPTSTTTAYLYGTTSPVVSGTWTTPSDIDTSGLTEGAATTGVIFSGSTTNTVNIYGNATFTASSSNAAFILGNATLNTTYYSSSTPTTSTLTISGTSLWRGSISGTIYASDGTTPITNIVFTQGSSNQGTITGNPSFNNAVPFTMGTVNGIVTLTRPSQTISGGTVTTLIKTPTTTDTLYLTAGTTLNVTNLTLGGVDANNLLILRSATPGTYATINIASTSANIQNIHLKDIHNIGTTIDLRGKNAYDDGGNTGFTFDTGNTLGSYISSFFSSGTKTYQVFVSTRNAVIAAITQRNNPPASTASQQQSQSISTSRSSSSFTPGTLNKISLPFIIPQKLDLKPIPAFGGTGKNSFTFNKTISSFLFAPLPENISKTLSISPSLKLFMAGVGIRSAQDIVSLRNRPIDIPATSTVSGIYRISTDSIPLRTTLTTLNKATTTITENVTAETGKTIYISLVSLTKEPVRAKLQGNDVVFTTPKGSNTASTNITLPTTPGRYYLTSDSAAFTLAIDVISPVKEVPVVAPKVSLWKRVLGWFGW